MISRNVISNYIGNLLPVLVGLFLTPILISHLGEVAFGLWILLQSIKSYFRLLEFGLKDALVKYIAEKEEPGSPTHQAYICGLVNTGFFIFLFIGGISFLASLVIAYVFPYIFRIPFSFQNTAFMAMVFLGLQLLFSFPSRIFYSVFRGYQRFDLLNGIFVSVEILNAAGILVLLARGFGLVSLIMLGVVLSALELVFQGFLIAKLYGLRISPRYFHRKFWSETAGYAIWSTLFEFSLDLGLRVDEVVIGILLSLSAITPYAIGRKLANLVFRMIEPLSDIFFPLSSQLEARKDTEGLRLVFLRGIKVSLIIATSLTLFLFFYGKDIIRLWIGFNYAGSRAILNIFLVVVVISAPGAVIDNILRGLGKLKFITLLSLIEGAFNLFLSIVLVRYYGLIGVGLGTLIPMMISSFFLIFPYICKTIAISWREILQRSVFPALRPLVFEMALLLGLKLFTDTPGILGLIWRAALSLAVYFSGYYLFTGGLSWRKALILWQSQTSRLIHRQRLWL